MTADPQFNSPANAAIDLRESENTLVGLLAADSLEGDALFEVTGRALMSIQNLDIQEAERFIAVVRRSLDATTSEAAVAVASLEAGIYLRAAQMSNAILRAKEGLTQAEALGLERYVARFANTIGSSYRRLGSYEEADRWYLEALVSARRMKARSREAGVLSNRSLLAKIRGEGQSAATMAGQAMDIYKDLGDVVQVARCEMNLGILCSWRGQYSEAEQHLESSIATFEAQGLKGFIESAHLALARLHRLKCNSGESLRLVTELLESPAFRSQPRKHVIGLEYLSDVLVEAGDYAAANQMLTLAFEIACQMGRTSDVFLECSYRLAFVQSHLGYSPSSVLALVTQAVDLARYQGDQYELACALLARARIEAIFGNNDGAELNLAECMTTARETGDLHTQAHAALESSRLAFKAGRSLDAMALAHEAKSLFERVAATRWIAEADTWLSTLLTGTAYASSHPQSKGGKSGNRRETLPIVIPEMPDFLSADPGVHRLITTALKLAPRSLSILLLGESGTGKELVAEAIHKSSDRSGHFVAVNCGALPGDLLEAELFGHARGAYTGANGERGGLIEYSHLGTLFLDEIGDMPLKAQARLLRALERGEVRRLGENSSRFVDLRIVAATHRNLLQMVSGGEFRLDLYHRLTGFVITIPPLRERTGDVDLLIDHFLRIYTEEQDKVIELADDIRAQLTSHSWPGNVRQLRNVVHRLVSLSEPGQLITRLPFELEGAETPRSLPEALDAEERRRILVALEASHWNKAKAAASLGASRTTLIAKMKRLGIEPPENGARVR